MSRTSHTWRRPAAVLLVAVAMAAGTPGGLPGGPAAAHAVESARAYYVSATGDDQADGLSVSTAWRSVARANAAVLRPGDRLLLQGGATFPGPVLLDAADAGDPARPVVLGSYGTGRARLSAAGTTGIFVHDTAGVDVRDLLLTGDATSYRRESGISFYNDLPGDRKLAHVLVARVEVSGFRHGILLGGGSGASGFRDVTVRDSQVHDNFATGLLTYGPGLSASAPTYANAHVKVLRVQAYRNVGDATDRTRNTGSGIVLGSVQGGTVEASSAWANGSACSAPEGPVGIWTYDSDRVVIRGNISHDNRTAGTADGGGFDLDQNVSNSVLERNLSYRNDGAGFLLYTGLANGLHRGNVVRFNISQGDGRKGEYGAVTLWGRVSGAQVHDNTVVALPGTATPPPVVALMPGLTGVALRNNVFVSDGAGALVSAPAVPSSSVLLQGNAYWATGGAAWQVVWGTSWHGSLAEWRTASRQETVTGTPTGLAVDPGLTDGRTPLRITRPAALSTAVGMTLRSTSPLLGVGVDLAALGTVSGGPDFFGNPVPAGGPWDVGAHHLLR